MFDDDTELQVLAYIRANPRSSIRHVAREIGVSYGYVQKILKKHKMHPYKINFVQHLRAGDSIRRLEFIA
jgi:AraC-like DNA-binding protein